MRKRVVDATITDALSGQRLDVMEQCVAINMETPTGANDAAGLAALLGDLYTGQCAGEATTDVAAVLITAGPAAGKSSLLSQVLAPNLA